MPRTLQDIQKARRMWRGTVLLGPSDTRVQRDDWYVA